uniref:Fas-binding factor 1 C-terminal domain-containing protein n=1 Tax=Arion vulgaris TaxID=1028688 RepID=A0A0B7AWU7_9EUPU
MQAQEEASQYRAHIEKREAEVQKQLNGFKLMEDHISQEKLRLAKEKKEVENLKNSSLCSNCRSPVHGNNVPHQNGYSSPQLPTSRLPPVSVAHLSASANHLSTSPLDHIAFSIANDRAVRMLKIQAIKDKEFLQEESMYLEGLRHMPYHSTASKS